MTKKENNLFFFSYHLSPISPSSEICIRFLVLNKYLLREQTFDERIINELNINCHFMGFC